MENDSNNQNGVIEDNEVKKTGCWAKFKSLFDDRGFDLEYEYNNGHSANISRDNTESEGYRRLDRNSVNKAPPEIVDVDGELSGVINFYEQFATISDEVKEESAGLWLRSTVRKRVSMRPSLLLTNILEESADGDGDSVGVVNRSPPPAQIPNALFYAPPEPLELLCVFPERASRVCAAACNAVARAGGEAKSVRSAREALDAFRRDSDARIPHVVVVDARQPHLMDAALLAR
ncbi:unnamed protein product [Colias eurytheme]|nr:unnamed protein product [Colias eurytheme]